MIDNTYQKQQALNEVREKDQKDKNEKESQKNRKRPLRHARNSLSSIKKKVNVAKEDFAMIRQIKAYDIIYVAALLAALLKDIFDLIEATGIGYLLVLVFTFIISIFIALMIVLGSVMDSASSKKSIRATKGFIKKALALLGGTSAEMLFGFNFLPIETLTVIIIYIMVLEDRVQNEKLVNSENKATQKSYA